MGNKPLTDKKKREGSSMEVESGSGSEAMVASPTRKLIAVASVAAGIQFGWALQLSLLTPYVQMLGVPHAWASFIWLCGPISGLLVQPIVGYYSDRCASRFGRRRPFIVAGAVLVAAAAFLIGYASDIGHLSGDDLQKKTKPRAVAVYVVGFWILDVANNMLQGPCRALLADLSGDDPRKMRMSNGFYSFFMAVGNVLGYAAGSYRNLYKFLPFTHTEACDMTYCANLKTCFFMSITLLLFLTFVALYSVTEKPLCSAPVNPETSSVPFFCEMVGAFRELKRPMWILLLVTCLNWIAWFPFLLYDTDWMGKEVYGGEVGAPGVSGRLYNSGVHAGALGLMLNSVVLGFMSLGVEPLARLLGGAKRVWGVLNFFLAACLAATVLITKMAEASRGGGAAVTAPTAAVKGGALAVFSALGIPLAVTYSTPFAMASIISISSGAGQGLSLGVLNLAIVVPQMFVSVLSGPWDALFGGSNVPAFVVAAVAAAASGVLALTLLPSPSPDIPASAKDATPPVPMMAH